MREIIRCESLLSGGSLLTAAAVLFLWTSEIVGEVEICTDGGTNVFQITNETCPFGVLFAEPQTADCIVYTTEEESAIMADVCEKEGYAPSKKQFQFIPEISPDPIEPDNSCKTTRPSMCSMPTQRVHTYSFRKMLTSPDLTFPKESNATNMASVKEQTQRMFEYMMGLGSVDIDESLRIVTLLKKSFEIFGKFCDPNYLRPGFNEDVETAFLFLFSEADATKVVDVSIEEFNRIMGHLRDCSDQKNPFRFEGKKCVTYSMIQRVNKSGILFSDFDTSNKNSFSKYDVPVEATWGALDFVHGLCYGTFRDHINSHHLYQRAVERLFTREILYRWKTRYVLNEQHVWNNFFSANVKNALMNMDICIQASYLSTPFLHRLERPIDGKARKKRWAEVHSLRNFDSIEGHCFQSKDEQDNVLNALCEN